MTTERDKLNDDITQLKTRATDQQQKFDQLVLSHKNDLASTDQKHQALLADLYKDLDAANAKFTTYVIAERQGKESLSTQLDAANQEIANLRVQLDQALAQAGANNNASSIVAPPPPPPPPGNKGEGSSEPGQAARTNKQILPSISNAPPLKKTEGVNKNPPLLSDEALTKGFANLTKPADRKAEVEKTSFLSEDADQRNALLDQIKRAKEIKAEGGKKGLSLTPDESVLLIEILKEINKGKFIPIFSAVKGLSTDNSMATVIANAMISLRGDIGEEDITDDDWSDKDSLVESFKKVRQVYRDALNIDTNKKWTKDHWLLWEYSNYKTQQQRDAIDKAVESYIVTNKETLRKNILGWILLKLLQTIRTENI